MTLDQPQPLQLDLGDSDFIDCLQFQTSFLYLYVFMFIFFD